MERKQFLLSCLLGILVLVCGAAIAQEDIQGSKDHPLISRYAGSVIKKYDTREFDEYTLLLGKVTFAPYPNTRAEKSEHLEGRITKISYENPQGRSTLEVYQNYEQELKKAGFEILFTCKNEDCGGRAFNHTVVPYWSGFAENYEDQRYLAAKLPRPEEGDVYVFLYIVRNYSEGGPTHNRVYTQLDVIEIAPMEIRMVKAEEMEKEITAMGHVALYGIYFDFDKADIKPESEPTITEIAKLLQENPALRLFVVGHTDNVGSLDYNLDLSMRRAQAVVKELASKHGIESSKLNPKGLGFLAPVASNRTEGGRAKNRRVELVEQ